MYRFALRFGVLLALAASAAAETEFSFAAGTDSTGRAEAVSNAAGRVMIESPEFPRGLWVERRMKRGRALAGLQVEYHGRPDGLVALRCVDPSGPWKETLLWTRPGGGPTRLQLKPGEPVDLPEGLVLIDLRIDPAAEGLLKPEEVPPLSGWEALGLYLQERWQGRTGRVALEIDGNTMAVDLAHPELEAFLADLQELAKKSLGEIRTSAVQAAFKNAQAFTSDLVFLEGVIRFSISFVLVEGSELEKVVLAALGRSRGPVTWERANALTRLRVDEMADVSPLAALTNLKQLTLNSNGIGDVSALSALTYLDQVTLSFNEIVDVSPLASRTRLNLLDLRFNQIVDISALSRLARLERVWLKSNRIVDVGALVANTGLGEDDIVDLSDNPLSVRALNEQIPALRERGVQVSY